MSELYDIVICIGPNDYSVIDRILPNIQSVLNGWSSIYIITTKSVIDLYRDKYPILKWIDEAVFPFTIQTIHDKFKTPQRSGWYLQQLLKIYACIPVPDMLDNFVILDADLHFHRNVTLFKDGKIMFNHGTEHHHPYFEHMSRMHPTLHKLLPISGICHMMPLRRHIVKALISMIETHHNGKPFWEVFLDCVDPKHYPHSGASEYEMLFTFAHQHFASEIQVQPLVWHNTGHPRPGFRGDYEACHWYYR